MFCLYPDIFSCVKINFYHSFFAFRLEMYVRCDNSCKTGADRGNILGQPMLFECMGIYILNLAHESEMRGYLVDLLIVKYLLILFKFSCSMLEWMAYCGTLGGDFF